MGLPILESILEKTLPDGTYKVNLIELLKEYNKRSGKPGIIVIDMISWLSFFYLTLEWTYGGQNKQLYDKIRRFCDVVESCGGRLVVFFDGGHVSQKQDTWIRKKEVIVAQLHDFFDSMTSGQDPETYKSKFPLLNYRTVAIEAFRSSRCCEIKFAVRECDQEVAEYAKKSRALGIIAQNSDYVIYDGHSRLLSAKHFDFETMETIAYRKEAFMEYSGLNDRQLAVFASIYGNGVIHFSELEAFHAKLCDGIQIRPAKKLKKVAEYVKTLPVGYRIYDHIEKLSDDVFGDLSMVDKLRASIDMYWLKKSPEIRHPTGSWGELVELAFRKHVKGLFPPCLYIVMAGFPYFSGNNVEDFRDESMPPISRELRKMRRKIYGVLFNEKPGRCIVVEEYCVEGQRDPETNKFTVEMVEAEAERPSIRHPGLEALWSDSTEYQDVRWRLFCYCISSKLEVEQVTKLEPHLVFPFVALYFLYHEVDQKFLHENEVEAFIIHSVQVKTIEVEDLKDLRIGKTSIRALQLAAKFNRVCYELEFLNAVCGFVVSAQDACPVNYFDGKLFHDTYCKIQQGESVDGFGLNREMRRQYTEIKSALQLEP